MGKVSLREVHLLAHQKHVLNAPKSLEQINLFSVFIVEYYAIMKMNKLLPHAIIEKSYEYDDGQKKFNHKEYILSEFSHKIPKEANE